MESLIDIKEFVYQRLEAHLTMMEDLESQFRKINADEFLQNATLTDDGVQTSSPDFLDDIQQKAYDLASRIQLQERLLSTYLNVYEFLEESPFVMEVLNSYRYPFKNEVNKHVHMTCQVLRLQEAAKHGNYVMEVLDNFKISIPREDASSGKI